MNKSIKLAAVAAISAVPQLAFAHVGDHGLTGSFNAGVLHPLLGLDHLLMLVAMGVLAGRAATRNAQFAMLAAVLLTMVTGMVLGLLHGEVMGMEAAIMGSLFVAAAAICRSAYPSVVSRTLTFAGTAMVLAHGWAHGVELGGSSLAAFAAGMTIGSLAAMLIGVVLAKRLPTGLLASAIATSGFLLATIG